MEPEQINQCLFCVMPAERIIARNALAYAIRDGFPVTNMHSLVIPIRHAADWFDITDEEAEACNQLIRMVQRDILKADPSVEGFNIGMNAGEVAGQTIFHCHIHLIPRRRGDVTNPRGGVRNVIPGKGNY